MKRPPKDVVNKETGETETVDFGHVGDVVEVDTSLINLLLDNDYLPVISSLGADDDGQDLQHQRRHDRRRDRGRVSEPKS